MSYRYCRDLKRERKREGASAYARTHTLICQLFCYFNISKAFHALRVSTYALEFIFRWEKFNSKNILEIAEPLSEMNVDDFNGILRGHAH